MILLFPLFRIGPLSKAQTIKNLDYKSRVVRKINLCMVFTKDVILLGNKNEVIKCYISLFNLILTIIFYVHILLRLCLQTNTHFE